MRSVIDGGGYLVWIQNLVVGGLKGRVRSLSSSSGNTESPGRFEETSVLNLQLDSWISGRLGTGEVRAAQCWSCPCLPVSVS